MAWAINQAVPKSPAPTLHQTLTLQPGHITLITLTEDERSFVVTEGGGQAAPLPASF